jgi:hypothetical protein
MSQKALKAYVEGPLQNCSIKEEGSQEDVFFTDCVRRYMTNKFIYTGAEDGSQRYHQGPMYDPLRNQIVRKSIRLTQRLVNQSLIYDQFNFKSISKESISFHQHKDPAELKRLEILLYGNRSKVCH